MDTPKLTLALALIIIVLLQFYTLRRMSEVFEGVALSLQGEDIIMKGLVLAHKEGL